VQSIQQDPGFSLGQKAHASAVALLNFDIISGNRPFI
jgi:hypothetical protein